MKLVLGHAYPYTVQAITICTTDMYCIETGEVRLVYRGGAFHLQEKKG